MCPWCTGINSLDLPDLPIEVTVTTTFDDEPKDDMESLIDNLTPDQAVR